MELYKEAENCAKHDDHAHEGVGHNHDIMITENRIKLLQQMTDRALSIIAPEENP